MQHQNVCRHTKQCLNTEQVNTYREQANDVTGVETGHKPKQMRIARHKQKHMVIVVMGTTII